MYRAAWRQGLKTTYYLRTLSASNIEKATVDLKKSNENPDPLSKEATAKKEYTEEEIKACSIQAMMDGEECEACQ
jgi:ribonucleoside-diphosphate reductase alpha chain